MIFLFVKEHIYCSPGFLILLLAHWPDAFIEIIFLLYVIQVISKENTKHVAKTVWFFYMFLCTKAQAMAQAVAGVGSLMIPHCCASHC